MTRILPFCVLASTILTLSACQQSAELHEMHDTTAEMRDITRDMRDQMKDMNSTTGKMSKSTNSMNDSMASMLELMKNLNELMQTLIKTTTDMNSTMQTMNGSLLSMKDVMNVMVKNTETLATKMDELAAVTKSNLTDMGKTMKSMDRTTNGLCTSRNPQAADMRQKNFDALRAETAIKNKITAATTFAQAMEFQNWGICGTDTLEIRDSLFRVGLEEFFARLDAVTSKNDAAKALASSYNNPNDDSIRDTNFNAIAFALDSVHDQQKIQIAKYNQGKPAAQQIRIESLESLILEAYADLKANKPLKEWEKLVVANNAAALRLLQARHNFMVAAIIGQMKSIAVPVNSLAISQLKKLTGHALLNGISLAFTKLMAGSAGAPWSTDISGLQAGELNFMSDILDKALQTRAALKGIGAKPVLDSELAPFIHNLSVTDDKRGPADLAQARTRFSSTLKKVQADL